MSRRVCPLAPLLLALVLPALPGCDTASQEGIQDWVTLQRAQTRPGVKPLAEPKAFAPQGYAAGSALDPFNPLKLTQVLRRDSMDAATSALLMPERTRPRQALEAYPLDAMAFVGSLMRQGRPVALVRVDRQIHQVLPGSYLGQNYGKVIRITETQVVLREIVQDALGEWTERTVLLQLQEDRK